MRAGSVPRVLGPALIAGTFLVGCERPRTAPPSPPPASFTVHIPCVISAPIQKVVAAYEESRAGVRVDTSTDKPLAMLAAVQGEEIGPGVVFTLGEVEMDSLVTAGVVDREQVIAVARNAYELAVIVSSENEKLHQLSDLAGPNATRVAIEDPKVSTLGHRAEQAFRKLGLWEQIAPKAVRFDPTQNVLSQLLDGAADAAVVFQDCLFESGGSPPHTIRLIGTLRPDSYTPITYQAAPLEQAARSEQAADFVTWLTSAEGRKALEEAGLSLR